MFLFCLLAAWFAVGHAFGLLNIETPKHARTYAHAFSLLIRPQPPVHSPISIALLLQMLQQHFMAAVAAQQGGQTDALAAHSAVISAALGALATWVEWTPMSRIAGSNVLDACAFFLTTPEFRLLGLDVLKQVRHEAWLLNCLTCFGRRKCCGLVPGEVSSS